jgi:hypothetical protein
MPGPFDQVESFASRVHRTPIAKIRVQKSIQDSTIAYKIALHAHKMHAWAWKMMAAGGLVHPPTPQAQPN